MFCNFFDLKDMKGIHKSIYLINTNHLESNIKNFPSNIKDLLPEERLKYTIKSFLIVIQ